MGLTVSTNAAHAGRPTRERELMRDLDETAHFEIGEGRAFITDLLEMHRQFTDAVTASSQRVAQARAELNLALDAQGRQVLLLEHFKHITGIRLHELGVEKQHLEQIVDRLGVGVAAPNLHTFAPSEFCTAPQAIYVQEPNGREWSACLKCLPRLNSRITDLVELDEELIPSNPDALASHSS